MPESLDDWVRTTLPWALAYARSLLRDPVAAEDVVQDCYARLIEHSARYDLHRDGLKILLRAVANASINRLTRERVLLSLDGSPDGQSVEVIDPAAPDPALEAIARELAVRIEEALARLPVGQGAAVHLTGLGYTLPEVAEMLGTTHGNARVCSFTGDPPVAEAIEAMKPMEKDAIFRLMSMTRQVIAACALTLYDKGKFGLDDPISKAKGTAWPRWRTRRMGSLRKWRTWDVKRNAERRARNTKPPGRFSLEDIRSVL